MPPFAMQENWKWNNVMEEYGKNADTAALFGGEAEGVPVPHKKRRHFLWGTGRKDISTGG
jgi:hypothetical protein